MPFYYQIKDTPEGRRTALRLRRLRAQLSSEIPPKSLDETLLLATWNIREFDSAKYNPRRDECLYYIAEIVSRFDLVAIQEVRDNLEALERLSRILGSYWSYIVTDVTEGGPGNRERMAFLFDSRKVRFGGLAGEVVFPPKRQNKAWSPTDQLARTPFLTGWKSGWFKFQLCTVHILWGDKGDDSPDRIKEVGMIASFLRDRATEKHAWSENMILTGDFNIAKPGNLVFQELTKNGFEVPAALQALPSNALKTKHYDQIAFLRRADGSAIALNDRKDRPTAGVFDFFQSVFCDPEDAAEYMAEYNTNPAKPTIRKFKDWRTYQMSDHLPMWVELKIDFADEYLARKEQGERTDDHGIPASPRQGG
jgi:hypothetical protein